jgi:hypothetical protein
MHSFRGDNEAQMLAQIKSLPEGEMKAALLDTYIKAMKTEQKSQASGVKKQPLFLEASYEKNTRTYMKHNREPKLQELSISDLARDLSSLKVEVAAIRRDLDSLQQEVEHGYPID